MRANLTLIFLLSTLAIVPGVSAQTCQSSSIAAITPDSQLTDNTDGTISDTKTGLMWKKCVEGVTDNLCNIGAATPFTWQSALERPGVVNSAGFATYHDWRLPNVKELASIVEEQCYDPAINLHMFPNTPSKVVWSGSPHAINGAAAWYVDFNYGYLDYYSRSLFFQVRLVRDDQ